MRTRLLALLAAVGLLLSLAPSPALALSADDSFPGVALPASPVSGSLSPLAGDRDDIYSVSLAAGDELTLSLRADAGTEFALKLFNDAIGTDEGEEVFYFWQSGYPKETSYVVPEGEGGTYSIEVHADDASGTAGNYTLTWSKRHDAAARMYGLDRYQTAAAVSRSSFAEATSVVLASGENYPDALTASALAGVLHAPVLLTRQASMPDCTLREIQRLYAVSREPLTVKIVGSDKVVSDDVMRTLSDAGLDVERIWGANRYETAEHVAERVKELGGSTECFLVSGATYADALSVSPIAYARKMPVLLTQPAYLSAETSAALASLDTTHVVIAGSTAAVSAATANAAAAALARNDTGSGHGIDRWEGTNRFLTGIDVADHAAALGWASWSQVGIATAWNFPDALGGGAALGERGGLLLLTDTNALTPVTSSALAPHAAEVQRAYLFGSTVAVSDAVRSAVITALH